MSTSFAFERARGGGGGRTSFVDVVDREERGRDEDEEDGVGDGLGKRLEEEEGEEGGQGFCFVGMRGSALLEGRGGQDKLVARTVKPPAKSGSPYQPPW